MSSALVAGKKMTLAGKNYERGDPVPEAASLSLEKLRTLQSVGKLVPAPEPVVAQVEKTATKPKKEESSGN